MSKTLKSYFDAVVCCNLAERPDRRYFIEEQYRRLFGKVDIEFHTSVLHPLGRIIGGAFNKIASPTYGKLFRKNEMWYAFEVYTIIKKAYLSGKETLLLLEDDIRFPKDPQVVFDYLDALPEKWDIIQGDIFSTAKGAEKCLSKTKKWIQHPRYGFWDLGFIGFSRAGMKFFMSIMSKYLAAADYPAWCSVLYPELISVWSSGNPIVIQVGKDISDISPLSEFGETGENVLHRFVNPDEFFSWNELVPDELKKRAEELKAMSADIPGFAAIKQRL